MMLLKIEAAKKNFFDRGSVTDPAEKARRRVHSKLGAYVRQRARTSIRKRKRASTPGSAPHSHVGLLRDLIFFSNDEAARSVVIGPAALNRPTGATWLNEYGGTANIMSHGKRLAANYPARPYMRPAFEAELPKLSAMWRDAINK